MPKIELKRPIAIDGIEYKKGTYEVPENVSSHWMVKAMVKDGDAIEFAEIKAVPVVIVEDENPETPEVPQVDELAEIKARLDALGVTYAKNIKLKKAKAALASALKR